MSPQLPSPLPGARRSWVAVLVVVAAGALVAVANGSIRDGLGGATAELEDGVRVSLDRAVDCRQPPLPAGCGDPCSEGGLCLKSSPPGYFLVLSITNTSSNDYLLGADNFALEDPNGRSLGRGGYFYDPEAIVPGVFTTVRSGVSLVVNPAFLIGRRDQPATLIILDKDGQPTGRLSLPNESAAAVGDGPTSTAASNTATVRPSVSVITTATAPPVPAGDIADPEELPVCATAEPLQVEVGEMNNGYNTVQFGVVASPDCWSGWVDVPDSAESFWVWPEPKERVDLHLSNGTLRTVDPGDQVYLPDGVDAFRLRSRLPATNVGFVLSLWRDY